MNKVCTCGRQHGLAGPIPMLGPLPGPAPAVAHLVGWFKTYPDGKLALQRVAITSEWPVAHRGDGMIAAEFYTASSPEGTFDAAWRTMLHNVFSYPLLAWARPWLRAEATQAAQTTSRRSA